MKRLIFIVEGETEERFVNEVLANYFCSKGIYNAINCFKTKHSGGGLSKYSYIKKDILNVIYESDIVVTTMLDFYRLPSDFPGYKNMKDTWESKNKVEYLEEELKRDIESLKGRRFDNLIPYIQLHEFEALIFSSVSGVEMLFEPNEYDHKEFIKMCTEFKSPEDINNGPDTALSKRLQKLIPEYNKVLYGTDIVKEIGMEVILAKCPMFKRWINKLVEAMK